MWIVALAPLACSPPDAAPPRNATLSGTTSAAWDVPAAHHGMNAAIERWHARSERPGFEGPPPPAGGLPDRVVPEAVGAKTIRQVDLAKDVGDALDERMRDFSQAQQTQYSVTLLTADELFGTESAPGLCEMPEMRYTFDEDGTTYEVSLAQYTYTAMLGDPEPMWVGISDECTEGLLASGGDIDAAVSAGACADDEAHTFFADDSPCRACVEGNAGDYASCLDAGTCPEEVPLAVWVEDEQGEHVWYRGVAATVWACAPDWLAPLYLMVDYGEDGVLPDTYDHSRWAYLCTPFWDETIGAPNVVCQGSEEPGERGVLAEGGFGFVSYLRPEGEDTLGWRGRTWYIDDAVFTTGTEIRWWWAYGGGLGVLSADREIADSNGDGTVDAGDEDWGFGSGGFGVNPHAERPDGDTMARDWLATAAMKVSTTINGIPIVVAQRSRCADDAWVGPDANGSYRCTTMDGPTGDWLNDGYITYADTEKSETEVFPVMTLASTGQIDEDVPGGVVVHLAGSTALADPDWEDCALPHSFTPDIVPLESKPLDWGGPAALDGQGWRFGMPDRPDFRVVLGTSRHRDWCGGDADGGGHSALDLTTGE